MKPTATFPLLSLVLLLCAATAGARPLERVPADGDLERALQRVSDGGVIEISAGVYPPPPGGFEVRSLAKSFTIRPAGDGEVIFDGEGLETIFFFSGDGTGSGHVVAFENVTFTGGLSSDPSRGGAVTARGVELTFVSSLFEANRAESIAGGAGGGAVRAAENARVRFVNCALRDNSAGLRGGAVFAVDSAVDVLWSELVGNRTNLPEHSPVAAGGAILALDSRLDVVGSRFVDNQAGWVGGAINAFGIWREPLGDPAALVTLHNSVFVGNRAEADPCCPGAPGPTVGGAIHVEDHTTLEIDDSRFFENVAEQGGAVSTYRGLVDVRDATFRGNRAVGTGAVIAAGGTFLLTSSDFADPSTNFGEIDRRPAELALARSLVEGRFGSTGVGARQGGCLFASGDRTRQEGLGLPRNDDPEANRARVFLDEVVFADCDARTDDGPARGGAIFTNLAAVEMIDSLVFDSDALGEDATGGAVNGFVESSFRARGSFFADNSASARGGAVILVGGEIDVSDSVFLRNEVSPGEAESIQGATGAALDMNPDDERDANVSGVVADSIFSGNVGLPIVDRDSFAAPFNTVRYDGNVFESTAFGNLVYKNTAVGTGGLSVTQLNGLVVNHAGGVSTDKSERANRRQAEVPRTGIAVAAPGAVQNPTAAGETPVRASAFIGHAWSGNAATLDGEALAERSGLERVNRPGTLELEVDGGAVDAATVGASGCSDGTLLCLNRDRFLLEVTWRDFSGNTGYGEVVPFDEADDSGIFFFFEVDNWEMLVKVLNGCGVTQHFWVFAAATTNVEYTLRVTDTRSGATTTYFNPLGNASPAITDTSALAVCDALETEPPAPEDLWAELEEAAEAAGALLAPAPSAPKGGTCVSSPTALCLNDERFRLEVAWRDFAGEAGAGETLDFRTDDSGLFFFFSEDNVEMLVKVLDGCGFNGHYWVFSAATTDVEYTLTVTDTQTGRVRTYFNRLGNAADAVTDTGAFETCP